MLEANAGAPALELLAAYPDVTLLFTDIVMPGALNGAEFARKALEIRPNLRVLFTSGYTEDAITHDGRLDPGVELLSKPYSREQLATTLRRVMS